MLTFYQQVGEINAVAEHVAKLARAGVSMEDAQKLFDAIGSKDKTFRVFTEEEGGAQHCQRDYLTLGVAEMWNWFEDKLKP